MHRFWPVFIAVGVCLLNACSEPPSKPGYWKSAFNKANNHTEKAIILGNLRKQQPLDASFLPLLHEILAEEKSPDVKVAAVRILADMKDASSLGPLQNALDFKASGAYTKDLNRAIAEALVSLNAPVTEAVFLEMLKTKDASSTLFAAIDGLAQLRSQQAVPFLLEILNDAATPPKEQMKCITALGQIADASAVHALERKLFHYPFDREAALALFRIGKPAADAMLLILQEKNASLLQWARSKKIPSGVLMANAATVLGDMQELRAEKILISKLALVPGKNESHELLRVQAANALGRMRSANAVTALLSMVSEKDVMMRTAGVLALAQIGDKTAIASLKKAVSQGDFDQRLRVMMGIALLGGEAELEFFNKQIDNERILFEKDQVSLKEECGDNSCDERIKRLGEQRMEALNQLKDILETGSKCEEKEPCWAEVLADTKANSFKRQRAAFFLGRSKNPEHIATLGKQLADNSLELRANTLLSISWIVRDNPLAATQAKLLIQPMQQQIGEERSSTQKADVRDEMWRLLWTLQTL